MAPNLVMDQGSTAVIWSNFVVDPWHTASTVLTPEADGSKFCGQVQHLLATAEHRGY
jgi:hypothetical protein